MKAGYSIEKIELCKPPGAIEVKNFNFLNLVENIFWYEKENISKKQSSIGCWHIKYKNK
jgi:hypothetical protein